MGDMQSDNWRVINEISAVYLYYRIAKYFFLHLFARGAGKYSTAGQLLLRKNSHRVLRMSFELLR